MRLTNNILTLALIVTLFSCNRLEKKGNEVIDKTKTVLDRTKKDIGKKASDFVDKKILKPPLDTPNTELDKQRFREYLLTEIPDDVKKINSYGDFFGADYKVLIAFYCDQKTIDKIIARKKMTLTSSKDDDGLSFMDEFPWWDKNKIELLEPYKVGKEYEYWEYLWYDRKTGQAYYEIYSL